jgi:hypothetical protein
MRRFITSLAATATLCLLGICAASASAEAPVILKTTISHLGTGSVVLEAQIDPKGEAGKFHFEYGSAACSSKPCTSTSEGKFKAVGPPVPIKAEVVGLTPGTTYHFRVLIKNTGSESATGPDAEFTTYLPPPVFGSCANGSFRAGQPSGSLPDCRAYEQASPIDKNGVDARGRVVWVKASVNGDAISYGAAGGIPGAEGSQELPAYLASRGAGDWSTQGLLPPQSAGQEAFVLGWTPDFSQTFSAARRLGATPETAFLERSSADRSLTEIAPYGSGGSVNSSFAGASADGSEVVFESQAKLTSAAIAGHSNVYVWDRASKVIRLAGVLNDKTAPPAGAFAGSYDWIAGTNAASLQSGGSAASYYTQDQHAITADGSLYFTAAGTGKLYLRRNPSQEQSKLDGAGKCIESAMACTIQVSATHKNNGTGEKGTDAAGEQPAAFLAASADGSKVLFSSSEKLTNDATTGPEPLPPAIGTAKATDGGAKNLGLLLTTAKGVATDAAHIYWTNPKEGTIGRSDLNGTPASIEPNFITGANNPQYVAVDVGHIYWTNAADGKAGTGTIGRADINGTPASIEEEFIKGANDPQGIAVNSEHIYWANAGDAQGNGEAEILTRTIGRADLNGTPASVEQSFIQVDHGGQEEIPAGLAVDSSSIYWTSNGHDEGGFVVRRDLDGSPASNKFFFDNRHEGVSGEAGITLDATHVYWARQGASSIGQINLALEESSANREFVADAQHPQGLALQGEGLYWSVNGELTPNPGNDLYGYNAKTGALSDLTVDTVDPNGAEVKGILGTSSDASDIYFVANGDLDGTGPASAGDCRGSAEQILNFSGECSLYLKQGEAAPSFIARLDASGAQGDAGDWLPRGGLLGQTEKTARVSADGSTVLYRSQVGGTPQFYRYQVGEAAPTCISCDRSGVAPNGGPGFGSINLAFIIPTDPAFTLSRNLSADGNQVFFETTEALVGADTNGADGCPEVGTPQITYPVCLDVYEWEAVGSGSCQVATQNGGCLYLLSTGKSDDASFFADASASGNDAFLITSSPGLVRQDQDQLYDVYDARVGGGLAAQNQVAAAPCEGDACKPRATAPPGFESPGSASFKGPGNVKKPACPKNKRKVSSKGKTRCVVKKQHKPHKKKHNREASKSGRASR